MRLSLVLLALSWPAVLWASANTQSAHMSVPVLNQDFVTPRVLNDRDTGVSYFLDSDGRHVSAVSPAGKLLWRVDPLDEAHCSAYRYDRPVILYFAVPEQKWWQRKTQYGKRNEFIAIGYNSTQFGLLRKSSGQFIFEGQD